MIRNALLLTVLSIFSFQKVTAAFDQETIAKATELLGQKKILRAIKAQLNDKLKVEKEEISAEQFLQNNTALILQSYEQFRGQCKENAVWASVFTAVCGSATYAAWSDYPGIAIVSGIIAGCAAIVAASNGAFLIAYPDFKTEEGKAAVLKLALDNQAIRVKKKIEICRAVINEKN